MVEDTAESRTERIDEQSANGNGHGNWYSTIGYVYRDYKYHRALPQRGPSTQGCCKTADGKDEASEGPI